ncbi:MAG: YdeI/OmpD-associated family protein [Roseibium album]|uniref:YdeI/OmpD-associated family protein n=1 Tax=Roseibium album TaxID=311410 RepID=UPI0032EBE383
MVPVNSVDEYVATAERFGIELERLRDVLRGCGLDETIKWGAPCYTWQGRNVVGLAAFKSYFGLWFHQGALLKDPAGVLVNAQEGKTRAQRQWRMTSLGDIDAALVRRYVAEAKRLAEHGRAIAPERGKPVVVPDELDAALRADAQARAAFSVLRPGLRREYAEHVAQAKRKDTRRRRVEKILPMIKAGAGLNDRYRRR